MEPVDKSENPFPEYTYGPVTVAFQPGPDFITIGYTYDDKDVYQAMRSTLDNLTANEMFEYGHDDTNMTIECMDLSDFRLLCGLNNRLGLPEIEDLMTWVKTRYTALVGMVADAHAAHLQDKLVSDVFAGEPDRTSTQLISAQHLPDGWNWVVHDDGSGSLCSPDGQSFFPFDETTHEVKGLDGHWCDDFDSVSDPAVRGALEGQLAYSLGFELSLGQKEQIGQVGLSERCAAVKSQVSKDELSGKDAPMKNTPDDPNL